MARYLLKRKASVHSKEIGHRCFVLKRQVADRNKGYPVGSVSGRRTILQGRVTAERTVSYGNALFRRHSEGRSQCGRERLEQLKKIAFLFSAICLVAFTISSTAAHASGLSLAPYVGQSVSMTVQPYASGENNGSFYVGLTQVNIAQNGTTIGSVEAFCDDFTHDISVPDTYKTMVQAVAGDTTMEQEAYYGLLLGSAPSGEAAMDSDIQELIWNYTTPANKQYALNSEMTTLQNQMLSNYQNLDYSKFFYLNAGDNGQSFMVTDPSPVPEPSTLASFGTGLFAAAGFARRRLSRS